MTGPLVCGHPTPNGPCTRKVLAGAGGCGYHPAPADPPEQRQPEPMATCDCERPLVLGRAYDDTPMRCFLCTKPVEVLLNAEGGPGQVDQIEARKNGDDPVQDHDRLLLGLLGLGEQDQ
jgi:hypothetical protein